MLRTRGILVALGLAAIACDAPDDHPQAVVIVSHDCDTVRTCDITERACEQAVLELTACVRGQDPPELPEIRKISIAELETELREAIAAKGMQHTPLDPAMQALHLLPRDVSSSDATIAAAASAWLAYYDDELDRITILDEPDAASGALEKMYTLSHEFTHYLQDLERDLTPFEKHWRSTADSAIAVRTLIEGEALVNSTRALAQMRGITPASLNWSRVFDTLDSSFITGLLDTDTPWSTAVLTIPYPVGGRYVGNVWNRYDREHVAALFDELPTTMADWIAGYGDGASAPSLSEPLDCAPPLPPEGFSVYALDRLGATGVVALLTAAGRLDLALGAAVRSDALAVYTRSDAEDPSRAPVLAVWRIRFRDAKIADRFASSLGSLKFILLRMDREVVISVSSDPAQSALTANALTTCPALDALQPLHEPEAPFTAIRAFLP